MGLVIIIFGAQLKEAEVFTTGSEEAENIGTQAFTIMAIFVFLSVVISVLGVLNAYCTKKLLIGCFTFFATLIFLAFLGSGIILIFIGNLSMQTAGEFCLSDTNQTSSKGQELFGEGLNELDTIMG